MKTTSSVRYCPKLNLRNSFKRHRSMSKRTVLKMLAVMENQQPSGPPSTSANDNVTSPDGNDKSKEFYATGRTGRRNALPNILQQQGVDTSDLPQQFENLTTKEGKCEKRKDQAGPSNASS